MKTKFLIACFILNLFCSADAQQSNCTINFDNLNLNRKQKIKIQKLDKRWQDTSSTIQPAIMQNKNILYLSISDPNISEDELKSMYMQLLYNQNRLKFEAIEVLIAKRKVLTRDQKKSGFRCQDNN